MLLLQTVPLHVFTTLIPSDFLAGPPLCGPGTSCGKLYTSSRLALAGMQGLMS